MTKSEKIFLIIAILILIVVIISIIAMIINGNITVTTEEMDIISNNTFTTLKTLNIY